MSILFDEKPLVINTKLAKNIGLNEAIFLQQLHYWLEKTDRKIDGKKWIYNTLDKWQEQFEFWSITTIKRVIKSLKELGYIEVKQLSEDKRNKTNYYTVNYSKVAKIGQESESTNASGQSDPTHKTKMDSSKKPSWSAPSDQNDPMYNVKSLTETTTEITTENITPISPTKKEGNLQEQITQKLQEFENINTDAFYEWINYKKYKNITAITKTLELLNNYNFAQQQEMVNQSIIGNYAGLFAPKSQQRTQPYNTPTLQVLNSKVNIWEQMEHLAAQSVDSVDDTQSDDWLDDLIIPGASHE